MVASRVFRVLALAAALGLLGTCDFFTLSTFPATASQLAAQRDLSAEIPASFARTFALSAVTAGSIDLVFLATQLPYDGAHLIVMDKDLHVLQTFSLQDLINFGASFSSAGAIRGTAGDVSIQGLHWSVTAMGLSSPVTFTTSPEPGAFCVTDGTDNYAGFNISGNTLSYYGYSAVWAVFNNYYPYPLSTNAAASFNLIGAYDDPSLADVVLIFEENNSAQDYCFTFPKSQLLGGLAFSPDLQTNYPPLQTYRADNRLIAYTQNGYIKFQKEPNGQGGTFIRLDMAGNTLPYSLRYTEDTDIQIATRNAGGWYYEYNRTTRMVRKISAWWGR